LFDAPSRPSVVCRSSQKKAPIEWQADFYAGCLLMPRRFVYDAWRNICGSLHPFIYEAARSIPDFSPRRSNWMQLGRLTRTAEEEHELAFDRIAREFAPAFGVSAEAMRIRLETLGLLLRDFPRQRAFSGVG